MPTFRHSHGFSLAAATAAAFAFAAAPASAIECPDGVTGDPLLVYCETTPDFSAAMLLQKPDLWFRMGDATGSGAMADVDAPYDTVDYPGDYKNGQSSGPIGISGDNDTARAFWGYDGYGYVNGVPAPGPDNGYASYTMVGYFFQEDTDVPADVASHDNATIMQFGGAGAVYIRDDRVSFRNGPDDEITVSDTFEDERWYMVVARKDGSDLDLWVKPSPGKNTPTPFNPGLRRASGTSTYRPGGSPTFYVGYGSWAPWFNGALDEVSYFKRALSINEISLQYYADPVPDGIVLDPVAETPATPTVAPAVDTPRFSDDSGNPAVSPRAAKLTRARARAEVKRVSGLVTKAQKKLKALRRNGAPARKVRQAKGKVTSLQKQLRRARAKVKTLS